MTAKEILQLIESLVWLLAGVGVFIVGMGFLSDSLEKSAGGSNRRRRADNRKRGGKENAYNERNQKFREIC